VTLRKCFRHLCRYKVPHWRWHHCSHLSMLNPLKVYPPSKGLPTATIKRAASVILTAL
jgi:hypothetical protein